MITQLADHLWQSTLFALAAGLLALALKKHSAGARYGLWFAASLKFLIPFALLAATGEALAKRLHLTLIPPHEAAASTTLDWAPQLMAPASAFGTQPPTPAVVPAARALASGGLVQGIDPAPLLFGAWMLGLALILLVWGVRWSRIRAALRAAEPIDLPAPIPVLASPAGLEPGVVGLWRPVLLLPEGVTERLPPAELNAILAHELSHVRRRDNLTGAIHMLVQALFWFHPLVWWLGARLIAERERACDEAVVRAGHDRETYARGIIETCRIYLHAPLACVAGASGGKLVTRVDTILTGPLSAPLPLEARAALGLMGAMALAIPVGAGLLTAPQIAEPQIAQALISRPLAVLAQAAHVAPLFQPAATAAQSTAAPPAARTGPAASAVSDAPSEPAAPAQGAAVLASDAPAETAQRPVGLPVSWPPEPPRVQMKPVVAEAAQDAVSPAAVQTATPAEIRRQAYRFAETFGATTAKLDQFARWTQPVCLRVQGLPAQAGALVKGRVEEIAVSLGVGAAPAGCEANVQILFTDKPQALLDRVAARQERLLGYWHRRDRDRLKTVTRPIQAWYVTSTAGGAATINGTSAWAGSGLPPDATGFALHGSQIDDEDNGSWGPTGCADNPHFTSCRRSEFQHVMVVVDTGKAGSYPQGSIADYVAMLALAQPKSLDGCQGLPSVIALFSACPGGADQAGLTQADAAYLTALYKTDLQAKKAVQVTDIAGRMADMLIRAGAIQVADAKTEAGPARK